MVFSAEALSDSDVLYHGVSPAGVLPVVWERRCILTDPQYVYGFKRKPSDKPIINFRVSPRL